MNDFSVWAAKMSLERYNVTIMHDNLKNQRSRSIKTAVMQYFIFSYQV